MYFHLLPLHQYCCYRKSLLPGRSQLFALSGWQVSKFWMKYGKVSKMDSKQKTLLSYVRCCSASHNWAFSLVGKVASMRMCRAFSAHQLILSCGLRYNKTFSMKRVFSRAPNQMKSSPHHACTPAFEFGIDNGITWTPFNILIPISCLQYILNCKNLKKLHINYSTGFSADTLMEIPIKLSSLRSFNIERACRISCGNLCEFFKDRALKLHEFGLTGECEFLYVNVVVKFFCSIGCLIRAAIDSKL